MSVSTFMKQDAGNLTMTSVSAHVAAALADHADHAFGIMGNGNAHFIDALLKTTTVPHTAVRHEAGTVVAADTYYRASGRLAVATTTYGAGFTNTLTPLAEAVQANIPLILVTGDQPTAGPRPWDVDQLALASAVGARTFTVGSSDVAKTTKEAVAYALENRVPVVLSIPYDLATVDAGPVSTTQAAQDRSSQHTESLDKAAVQKTLDALASAKRPFLLAGRGAWLSGAGTPLGALADALGAVTASTALARGIFPDTRYDLGVTGGFGAPSAMDLVREADVAVIFGASLNQFTMRFGDLLAPGTQIIQVDVSSEPTHPRVDTFIRGDAAAVASLLVDGWAAGKGNQSSGWRESLDIAHLRQQPAGDPTAADGRLDPRAAAARIAELLPEDRVVVSDGGHFIGWANMYWPVQSPDRMHMVGTAYQSIGMGFPSVVGAAIAHPASTVVLTTGDGGGLMALADLESAVRVAAGRGLAVVWNDAAYGAEINLYGLKGLAKEPMLIPEVDFSALAAAVGAQGVTVRTLSDLDILAGWSEKPAGERPFLLLDLQISGSIIAPFQEEIIRLNS